MCGCGGTSAPRPGPSSSGPMRSAKMNGPTIRRAWNGSSLSTSAAPMLRRRGAITRSTSSWGPGHEPVEGGRVGERVAGGGDVRWGSGEDPLHGQLQLLPRQRARTDGTAPISSGTWRGERSARSAARILPSAPRRARRRQRARRTRSAGPAHRPRRPRGARRGCRRPRRSPRRRRRSHSYRGAHRPG